MSFSRRVCLMWLLAGIAPALHAVAKAKKKAPDATEVKIMTIDARRRLRSACLALLLIAAAPAFAQQAPERAAPGARGEQWSSLSADQRRLLERFRDSWNALPPQRQEALARGSERWLSMSPEQRKDAKQRFERWRDLSPEQRRQMRDRWDRFLALTPQEQEAVRDNFRKFENLPPERRRKLRERWESATPAERERMLERSRQQRQLREPRQRRLHRPG